jgi:hypothetical protein
MHKLKVGLIVDDYIIDKHVANLVFQSKENASYSITHFVVYDFFNRLTIKDKIFKYFNDSKKLFRLLDLILFSIVIFIDKILLHKSILSKEENIDIRKNFTIPHLRIRPIISTSGFIYRFSKEDILSLKEQNFDVLIRCGSGILKGEILNAARFGILSFHHGDNDFFRGGPAGFWECFYGMDETGFIIQRLTEELDGGIILCKGSIPTNWFYKLNQEMILKYSTIHMHCVIQKLASGDCRIDENFNLSTYSNKLYSVPELMISLFYLSKLTFRIFKKVLNKIIGTRIYWGIAIGKQSSNSFVFWKAKKINHPTSDFIADPFLIQMRNETYLICEEFNFKLNKAHISAFLVNNINKLDYLGPILEESFHLSFPFIFEYCGKYYMTPESFQNREVRLYETDSFPFGWKLKKVIFNNISAADTFIIHFGEFWWLFTNIDTTGGSNHHSELYAFYSDDPVNGDWISHKLNPILFSSSGGRNAGVFVKDGKVYRCGQNQGIDNYGKSFSIFEIIELNPHSYIEKLVANVNPNFYHGIIGTHHLSSIDEFYTIDFKYKKYFHYK